ncbi:hypothetical protein EMPS_10910 [Entomortierella parvispora]|uniref:Uncharacterized protein n=1 Tax=Entomortierella parvispora TaxID=205924 RepID=A0A9P3M1G2_9FUNG|nr:hypothetical protein EMPS_10910 [Entomortierella parvispora]
MQAQYNQDKQQQLMPTYPQPPRLTRPSSVLLEPSTGFQGQEMHQSNTRPRSQSQTIYSTYLPPPAAAASPHSGTSSSVSDPENPVRFQNWRQPAHRSKLSKQYTPSEEDSDEETSAANAEIRRRSKFMSGAPLELNTSKDKPRAPSRLTMTLTPPRSATPSMSDKADTVSVKSATKKLTLGKRISRFFGGGGSSKSSSTNDTGSTSDISSPSSSDNGRSGDRSTAGTRTSRASSAASLNLPPVQELTPPERLHGASSLYNMHQRSHSTPEQIGSSQQHPQHHHQNAPAQYGAAPSLKLEENRLRKARDSGFEEAEGRNGHRRYSSTIVAVGNRGIPPASGASMPNLPNQQQLHQQHQPRHSQSGSGSPQLRPYSDRESMLQQPPPVLSHPNQRHSFMGAELTGSAPPSPRRSSTPVPHSSETLISKVDREKASVCFQQPNVKRDSFIRDSNLDPVLSNLVQQHRKDFKTNQRLGGSLTPTPQHPHQQQGSPRTRSSTYMDEHLHHGQQMPIMLSRDPAGARRDSSASQHQHYFPPSPGLHASDAQMKRLSTSSQMLQQQQQHPYGQHHRSQASGSNGSLHQYQQGHPSPQPHHHHHHHHHHQQQQQYHPHSPMVGPQRTSPKRQSSAGYFSASGSLATLGSGSPLMMSHQLPQGSQIYSISPLPSPNMGAVSSMGYVPDLALPQQQQLEQLQLIRIQQQQLLLQQQMQLQQQLQQTRAAAAVMATAPSSPLMMMPSSSSSSVKGLNIQQQSLQQQQQPLQGAIVMGPTLTTAVPLTARLADEGAVVATSIESLLANTNIVFTSLSNDAAVESVYGVLLEEARLRSDPIVFVETSIIYPTLVTQLATQLASTSPHHRYLQHPVFGRPAAAAAAQLVWVTSGDATTLQALRPYIESMSRAILDLKTEDVARASAFKLLGNFLVVGTIELLAEGFALGEKNAIAEGDVLKLIDLMFASPVWLGYSKLIVDQIQKTADTSSSTEVKDSREGQSGQDKTDQGTAGGTTMPLVASSQPRGFPVTLSLKDMGHMCQLAKDSGARLPTADVVHQNLKTMEARGYGDQDWTTMVKALEE